MLSEQSIEHVVLERGDVANTWKTERWDSLRLLTPNWLTRLPGLAYDGEDPDGFMAVEELIEFLERYADHVDAPVRTRTTVTSLSAQPEGYLVETDNGSWEARAVVVASGAYNQAKVPAVSASLSDSFDQLTPLDYKRPDQLRPGRVLVVGASATGIQIGDELLRSGREVTVAVGEHVRMPGPIGTATSCGGWSRSAGSTSVTTRSTTWCARGTYPPPKSSERPTARTSISTP